MARDAGTREALRRRYLKVDTATVADVLDVLGLPNQGLAPSEVRIRRELDRGATLKGMLKKYGHV